MGKEVNEFGLPPSEVFVPRTISNAQLGIPEYKVRKKPKPRSTYKKPQSIKDFEIEFQTWQYRNSLSDKRTWVLTKFSDNSANALTKIIMQWLRIRGGFGARVNSQGTYDPRKGRFIRSGSTKGASDISAIIKGRAIELEIKYGRDKLRPDQIKYKADVENAGGVYLVIKTFDGFLESILPYMCFFCLINNVYAII